MAEIVQLGNIIPAHHTLASVGRMTTKPFSVRDQNHSAACWRWLRWLEFIAYVAQLSLFDIATAYSDSGMAIETLSRKSWFMWTATWTFALEGLGHYAWLLSRTRIEPCGNDQLCTTYKIE